MSFTLYRLPLSDPLQFYEQLGDPITTQGGAPVPALRSALRHTVGLSTFSQEPETIAKRLQVRRQLRSLINNTPMKLTGFYVAWGVDPEQSGWYMPDQGQFVDIDASVGMATGVFKMENFVFVLAGRPRTHRRAMWVYLKDLRTGQWARDFRRLIYSTEFAGLSTLALGYLPPGLTDPLATSSGATVTAVPLPAGEDAGQVYAVTGMVDLARISYEQSESARNLGQVVAYDRRGNLTAPTNGPDASWEEFYGPDYPYSWQGEVPPSDTPLLDNGRCRVRWDGSNQPGWRIDVWTGTKWEEQGKVTFSHNTGVTTYRVETLLSASLVEYGETRAIMQAVMRASEDPTSRVEILVTLQRGWSGPRFEVYTSTNASGEKTDGDIEWTNTTLDTDTSAIKIDAADVGSIAATAKGSGHTGLFAFGLLGASAFTGENEIVLARWGAPYGVALAMVQAAPQVVVEAVGNPYGVARNGVSIYSFTKLGYLSAQLAFLPQKGEQALECESMTLSSGTTSVADAEASNGKAAQAKRTSEAAHVTQANWPNSYVAKYRIFARVKATSGTLKLKANTGTTTGAIKTTTAAGTPGYVWVDLGDVESSGTLEIRAWQTAAVFFQVDRIEAFLLEDRLTGLPSYGGARDLGQACLSDSRMNPTLVTRSV